MPRFLSHGPTPTGSFLKAIPRGGAQETGGALSGVTPATDALTGGVSAERSGVTDAGEIVPEGTAFDRDPISRRTFLAGLAGVCGLLGGVGQAAEPTGRRFAFLVGVTKYNHSMLRDLEHCDADINDLAELLARGGFDGVYQLTSRGGERESSTKQADPQRQPEAETIRQQLRHWLQQWKVTKDDLILMGLSGHGVQPRGSDEAYFCPKDANPVMQDAVGKLSQEPVFPKSLVGLSTDLLEILTESGIGYRLLLVDACRDALRKDPNKGKGAPGGLDQVPFTLQAANDVQTALLLSCSKGEKSYEGEEFGGGHGAFFLQVLRGLQEGLAVDGDQNVTLNSLENHVTHFTSEEVERVLSQKQNPNVLKNVRGRSRVLLSKAELSKLRKPGDVPRESLSVTGPPPGLRSGMSAGEVQQLQRDWARHLKLASPFQTLSGPVKLELALIPPGTFLMGSEETLEQLREAGLMLPDETDISNESPVHEVELTRPFWLGVTEVTRGQFAEFVKQTGYVTYAERPESLGGSGHVASKGTWEQQPGFSWRNAGFEQTDDHPVMNVSHNDAVEFLKWLSAETAQKWRLPTEAEWEFACRAGSTGRFHFGNDFRQLIQFENRADAAFDKRREGDSQSTVSKAVDSSAVSDGYAFTAAVAQFRANPLGLYDLLGNVSEWCYDWYDEGWYKISRKTDPAGVLQGMTRVRRGGNYKMPLDSGWVSWRYGYPPDYGCDCLGFRVVRSTIN